MNFEQVLSMVKMDLGIVSGAYDQRLKEYIKSAKAAIEREGIKLISDSVEDMDIVARYAAWMWRKRDTGEGIPRMIRWQLNNKIFSANEDDSE